MSGAIDMGSKSISNLKGPTTDLEAANKAYVDLSLSNFSISLPESKLSISGGTMSGTIDMGGYTISNVKSPTNNLDAANKAYVDNAFSNVDLANLDITLPDTKIFVGTSSNTAVSVMLNGDASLTSSGTITLNNNAVNNDKLDKINIPLSGFGDAEADVDLGGFKLTSVATPA